MTHETAMDVASELAAALHKIEDRLADLGTRLDSLTATASLVALSALSHDHPDMKIECLSMLSKACRDWLK